MFALHGANAQDFYSTAASARSKALGGIYVPSDVGVADSLAANPAGLTALGGATLDLSLGSVFARGSFSNPSNPSASLQDAPGVVPYGGFGAPIGHSRFSFGVGLVPELLSTSNWHYIDPPGFAGASYGFQHEKSAIVAISPTAGIGIEITPDLSVGVAFGAVYNSNTLDAPYIFQTNPSLKGLKTLLDLQTSGFGWNMSAGVLARPSRNLRLDAAWKSRTAIDSTGSASGNAAAQFNALGLPFRPDFHYSATVHNVLPQSVLAGALWNVDPRWLLAFQAGWVDWRDAFTSLPVALANGNNADIDGFLHSNALFDSVPLHWKDQFSFHAGFERTLTENLSFSAGVAHANDPVPAATLSPLTAAIVSNQVSTGFGYRMGRTRFDLAYSYDFEGNAQVGQSALLFGEYDNSRLRVGTQAVTLTTSFKL